MKRLILSCEKTFLAEDEKAHIRMPLFKTHFLFSGLKTESSQTLSNSLAEIKVSLLFALREKSLLNKQGNLKSCKKRDVCTSLKSSNTLTNS